MASKKNSGMTNTPAEKTADSTTAKQTMTGDGPAVETPAEPGPVDKSTMGKKLGRKPMPKMLPAQVPPIEQSQVVHLKLADIDLEDHAFMFRAKLNTEALEASLGKDGQQLPIIVRKKANGRYQIISGFRRVAAIRNNGWETVAAIVRTDVDSDEEAFRVSVLENTFRKTYSDIDRAYVIKAYKDRGYQVSEIGDLLGLQKRQVVYIQSLLTLPSKVQSVIDNENQHFKASHAIALMKFSKTRTGFRWEQWIKDCNERSLSVPELQTLVRKHYRQKTSSKGFTSLFEKKGTRWDEQEIAFAPMKVKMRELSDKERAAMKVELGKLLTLLG